MLTSFYDLKGVEVLIQVNEATGSITIRNHSLAVLDLLVNCEDSHIAYLAYHAVFQIYPREVTIITDYLKSLNERVSSSRGWLSR